MQNMKHAKTVKGMDAMMFNTKPKKFKLPRKEKKRFKKLYYQKWMQDWFKGYYNQYNYNYFRQTGNPLPF